MLQKETSALGHEWATLQNNHEAYEKSALLIKFVSIALFVGSLALIVPVEAFVFLMLVLWLQEGIFKTYQTRLGERIWRIEQMLGQDTPDPAAAYQLHSEWLASRPGFTGLLAQYGKSMLRPTVAFPHVVLMLMAILWAGIG